MQNKGILYPNGSAYNPEEVACIAAAAAAAASDRGEIAGERDAGSDERYRREAAAVHTLRVHENNVTWLPVMAAAGWAGGDSISNGAEAVGGEGIERYAEKKVGRVGEATLNFQPQSAWVLQSAGHDNILPWNNKPYRGMAVASTAAVGAQVTVSIVAPASARAVVMYYSTVVGSGGVLKVSAGTLSDAAADQGCVYFAAADGNGTHSNQVLLFLSPATEPAAEAERAGAGAGAGGAAEHAKAREGWADEGAEPLGGGEGRQRKEVAAATVLVNENAMDTVAVTATVVAAGPVLISGFDVWEQIPDRRPAPAPLCKR